MSVDTSAEAVGWDVDALTNGTLIVKGAAWDASRIGDRMLALAAERDALYARYRSQCDATMAAHEAAKKAEVECTRVVMRPDIAAILRGEAVAVPVEATKEMVIAGKMQIGVSHRLPHDEIAVAVWGNMLAASPFAVKP